MGIQRVNEIRLIPLFGEDDGYYDVAVNGRKLGQATWFAGTGHIDPEVLLESAFYGVSEYLFREMITDALCATHKQLAKSQRKMIAIWKQGSEDMMFEDF